MSRCLVAVTHPTKKKGISAPFNSFSFPMRLVRRISRLFSRGRACIHNARTCHGLYIAAGASCVGKFYTDKSQCVRVCAGGRDAPSGPRGWSCTVSVRGAHAEGPRRGTCEQGTHRGKSIDCTPMNTRAAARVRVIKSDVQSEPT